MLNNYKFQEIKRTKYYNLFGRSLEEVFHWFPHDLNAEKVVLLPDLCPGRSPLPTGCSVEINIDKQPNWRKFAVSDIGCGMQVLKSNIKWEKFEKNIKLWDKVYEVLKKNKGKLGDLGSGNHFLDAVIDEKENVYFVIHTGSRHESFKVEGLENNPVEFDKTYKEVVEWARLNRDAVANIVESVYGELEFILDKTHNSYEKIGDKVIIRKGAVKLKPKEITIIPSSMDSDMVIVEGKDSMEEILFSMSHGTGRIKSRGESKGDAYKYDFSALRKRIYIPEKISDASILTENPSVYRDLDECLKLVENFIIIKKRLTPVAYIGQV